MASSLHSPFFTMGESSKSTKAGLAPPSINRRGPSLSRWRGRITQQEREDETTGSVSRLALSAVGAFQPTAINTNAGSSSVPSTELRPSDRMSPDDLLRNLRDVIQTSGIQNETKLSLFLQGALERLRASSVLPPSNPVRTDWDVDILKGYAEERGTLSEKQSAGLIALSMLCQR